MPNPFDWRTVLLAKHAQHVAIIHFPIALFIVGVIFDAIGALTKENTLKTAAFLNFSAAAVAVLPAVLTGVAAWQWLLEGKQLKGILLYHVLAASASAVLIVGNWWIHFRARRRQPLVLPSWRLATELAGSALVIVTGHLGGFLTGVNG
jgi:uncharacterized membrane protein